jgi:type IV pilus assembly protein PilB
MASKLMVVPVQADEQNLQLAMIDPDNLQTADTIASTTRKKIQPVIASEASINAVLAQYQFTAANLSDNEAQANEEKLPEAPAAKEIQQILQDSPVAQTISKLLDYAVRQNASDIHIEPTETIMRVRCRIDGVLKEVTQIAMSEQAAVLSKIKIMSGLKIDEHRRPQDGGLTVKIADEEIDLRVAISPVIWGEQVVIRLLRKEAVSLNLTDLGLTGRTLRVIQDGMSKTSGMILISGPTGSGKSTTLYAILKGLMSDKVNIITLEDPVEYKIDGINQIQIDESIGLTFASGLRSILRLDPDIIMVGEIRDEETAELAVQASLTGHLVLATLHTNSAAGILPRFLDMGIEPFLLSSTINVALAQRLVRQNVAERTQRLATPEENEQINNLVGNFLPTNEEGREAVKNDLGYSNLPLKSGQYQLFNGVQSELTPDGFKGRLAIYEAMGLSNGLQKLILDRATSGQIEAAAITEGMLTMRQDGYLKALNGDTTIEEVNRVAYV